MHVERVVGLTVVYTSTTLVDGFVLGVILASVVYFLSERYKRSRGVTPWRVPSGMWAVLLFLLSLIGVVLYLIACFTTRPKTGAADWVGGDQRWGPGPRDVGGRSPESWNERPPGRWGSGVPQGSGCAGSRRVAVATARLRRSAATRGLGTPLLRLELCFPGWVRRACRAGPRGQNRLHRSRRLLRGHGSPDPSGRHELRYWDGTKFTEHVADAGKISTDPM